MSLCMFSLLVRVIYVILALQGSQSVVSHAICVFPDWLHTIEIYMVRTILKRS